MTEATLLVSRYEIGEVIGRGGMAEVHRGRDTRLGRTVAIKMLRIDLVGDATFQERFRREAQASASLNHPNIVSVYDTGEDFHLGVRVPFIVMEYVEGRTLRDLIRDDSRLTQERALEITADVCDALSYSHRAGIIHRDIKPGNVMVTGSGQVKVMDFGIARALADAGQTMTQTAMVVGTAQYLSPEQARGEMADPRSDLYSTGCLLFELLVRRPPFVGDSLVSVAMAHVKEPPPAPSSVEPSIPRDVDSVVLKALAKERGERYQSATEMARDIRRAMTGRPVVAAPAEPERSTQYLSAAAVAAQADRTGAMPVPEMPAHTTMVPAVTTPPGGFSPSEPRRRGYGALVVGVLVVLALSALAGFYLVGGNKQEVRVPDLFELSVAEATDQLRQAGFVLGDTSTETSDTVDAGLIVDQSPSAGDLLEQGQAVDIVVSGGKEQVSIPRVVGLNIADARAALGTAGLEVAEENRPSDKPSGEVLSADPAEGTPVDVGSTVTLTVSSGEVAVPQVEGKTRAEAEVALTQAGFEVAVVEVESDQDPGTVLSQTPRAESLQAEGSRVTISVAIAPTASPTGEGGGGGGGGGNGGGGGGGRGGG